MKTAIGYHYARLISPQYLLVTDLAIPKLDPPPEIIIWGSRAFMKVYGNDLLYAETTSYVAPYEEPE